MATPEHERKLYELAKDNQAVKIRDLLKAHPGVDVNWRNPGDSLRTALHAAAERGWVEVVQLLLADPKIDPNVKDDFDETALQRVCSSGVHGTFLLLLCDPRVDLGIQSKNRCTPLWTLACNGHLPLMSYLLASGRNITFVAGENWLDGDVGKVFTPLEIAKRRDKKDIVSVLTRYAADAWPMVVELRNNLGLKCTFDFLRFFRIFFFFPPWVVKFGSFFFFFS